ncbi:hypothetical protein FRC10_004620 [Ceratobasidium sp. 414]|nr:hypothetical protein FRC10_004620 [Ceratobasidium sp. 414]
MAPLTSKYPEGTPFEVGMLEVSKEPPHTIYYEVSGNKDGNPGGPGGGTSPSDRTYFDPEKYKIVLFDQRGCGKSQPSSSLEANTTWDLVADIEKLREKLNIDKWGSTLSLAYAQTHPGRVKALILRELDFFYQNGTSHLFPEAWEEYVAPVPEAERSDFIKAYNKLLNSEDEKVRITAARAWSKWEMTTSKLFVDEEYIAKAAEDDWANAFARIENHYFINEVRGFMREGQLLEKQSIDKILVIILITALTHYSRHIPTIVVQGRYDVVCPTTTAWALKRTWSEIDLKIVPDAGHSAREPGIAKLLTEASALLK